MALLGATPRAGRRDRRRVRGARARALRRAFGVCSASARAPTATTGSPRPPWPRHGAPVAVKGPSATHRSSRRRTASSIGSTRRGSSAASRPPSRFAPYDDGARPAAHAPGGPPGGAAGSGRRGRASMDAASARPYPCCTPRTLSRKRSRPTTSTRRARPARPRGVWRGAAPGRGRARLHPDRVRALPRAGAAPGDGPRPRRTRGPGCLGTSGDGRALRVVRPEPRRRLRRPGAAPKLRAAARSSPPTRPGATGVPRGAGAADSAQITAVAEASGVAARGYAPVLHRATWGSELRSGIVPPTGFIA